MILRLYPSLTNSAWTYISCSSFGRLDISGNTHQTTCPFAQVDREAPGMSWHTCIAVGSGWVLVNLRPCSCGSISQGSKEMQGTYRGQRKSELIVLHVQRWSTGFLSFLLPSSFVIYFPPLPGLSILQGWCQIRSTRDPSYNVKLGRSPAQDRGARSNHVPPARAHELTSDPHYVFERENGLDPQGRHLMMMMMGRRSYLDWSSTNNWRDHSVPPYFPKIKATRFTQKKKDCGSVLSDG